MSDLENHWMLRSFQNGWGRGLLATGILLLTGADWPQFRGPDGQGHSEHTNLPSKWSETENVAWRTLIPGAGWSSPVIDGDQVWLTTATQKGEVLRALCLDTHTGRIVHNVELFLQPPPGAVHAKNSYASPTPILGENRVWVHFGSFGTACLDRTGEIIWRTQLHYLQHHGPASSPVLFKNLLIVVCDGIGPEHKNYYKVPPKDTPEHTQFVVALDAETGQQKWLTPRYGQHAYATPLVIEVDGEPQLIAPGGDRVTAYNPRTGEQLWTWEYTGYSVIPRPLYEHGLIYLCTGYDQPKLLALKPAPLKLAWECSTGVSHTPSPVLVGERLYFVSDGGVGTCLDALTGKPIWKRRLGGTFSASPIAADGKVYFTAEDGTTHVLAEGPQYKRLSVNKINGMTYASLGVSDRTLWLRSDKALYCLRETAETKPLSPTRQANK